jgi:hypothetical protein
LAQIYRDKVARLHEELNRPELREEASAAIRSLIPSQTTTPAGLGGVFASNAGRRQKKSPATLRWGGNSDRREVTMRLFRSAVLIIMLGVVGCKTAAGPQVRLPAVYHGDHGGRHG